MSTQETVKIYQGEGLLIERETYGDYSILHLRGTYTHAHQHHLLKGLKETKLRPVLATTEAGGYDMGLCRELVRFSRKLKKHGGLILLNPAAKLMEYIAILSAENQFKIIHHRDDLPESTEQVDRAAAQSDDLMTKIRKEIRSNPVWHLCDRDFRWVCPFCGALQEHIYIQNHVQVSQATLDDIYEHLKNFCPPYVFGGGVPLPKDRLDGILGSINREKYEKTAEYTARLKKQVDHLKTHAARSQQLEASLQMAKQRQTYLLPEKAPDLDGASFGILYRPAEELSGDFYDFVPLETHRTAFIVGDVTGHGIEAGIVMGMAKKVLQIRARETGDIRRAILQANADIYPDLGRQTFVTALMGIYDSSTKVLEHARAGHTPPVLFNPGRTPRLSTIETKGLAMGLDDGSRLQTMLETTKTQLQSGDLVLFYTDGVIEAMNPQKEEFGFDLLHEFCEQSGTLPPEEFLANLLFILEDFVGGKHEGFEDDITAIALKIE